MSNKKIYNIMENFVMSDELKDKIRKQTTQKEKVVKFRKRSFNKVALVACLCVAMLGTMTVAAAVNIEKIENYFAQIFNMDTETQKKLEDEGYVQDMDENSNESDRILIDENGVKVTLKETLADKRSIMALISVTVEEGIKLDDYVLFQNLYGNFDSGSLYGFEGIETPENERLFCVHMNKATGDGYKDGDVVEFTLENMVTYDFDGEKLCKMEEDETFELNGVEYRIVMVRTSDEMDNRVLINGPDGLDYYIESVSDGEIYNGIEYEFYYTNDGEEAYLYVDGYDVILSKGEWKVSWQLTANDNCLNFDINEEIEANGYKYCIDRIQLTSFSIDIDFYERALAIDEEYVWENAVLDEGDWEFYEQLETEGDIPEPPYIQLNVKVAMKDGSIKELTMMGDSYVGHDEEWYQFGQIGEVLDLENVEKIIVEGHEYYVNQ